MTMERDISTVFVVEDVNRLVDLVSTMSDFYSGCAFFREHSREHIFQFLCSKIFSIFTVETFEPYSITFDTTGGTNNVKCTLSFNIELICSYLALTAFENFILRGHNCKYGRRENYLQLEDKKIFMND